MKSKRLILRALTIIVVGLLCVFRASATENVSGLVGDSNHDGRLGISDVVLLIDGLLNESEANGINDIDCDGRLSINDVTSLIDIILDDPKPIRLYTVNGVLFKMVLVKGGTFQMGATSEQASDANYDEYPVHQLTLSGYFIGQTQVTQELWQAVMGDNPSGCVINPQCPVENVSWEECIQFINNLNAMTGCSFRLPTEAEWEFAARGGNNSRHYKYSGSNNYDNVAWCEMNSNDLTHPVGKKAPNELGIYDMSGNVWEWCQDWWGLYTSESSVNPTGPDNGDSRVCRGGCMRGHYRFCRIGYRQYYSPNTKRIDLGLRLAL